MKNLNNSKISITGFCLLFILMFTFNAPRTQAQGLDSKGKDFWLMFNTNYDLTGGLQLFITSDVNTSGTVSGLTFASMNYSVTANQVTTITIPIGTQTHTSDVVDNRGIHVVANDEVTVYGLNQRTASTDAYLGLPTDVLGTDYMILTYMNVNVVNGVQLGVVATEDNTTVTITPSVTTGSRTAGTPYNITMNKGQAYQLQNGNAAPADLTGSLVSSDKPIGVFGASQCANIPNSVTACDHICEMMPPRSTWGTKFGTVPLKTRTKGDSWRFLASEDNTTIKINGTAESPINKGQYIFKNLTTMSIIESDKPILVAQYSNGTTFDGVTSDPFMMLIPPLEQFLANYTLGTPASGFVGHHVNLIAPNSVVGSLTLDGSPIASGNYTAIGSSGFSGAQITVSAGSHTFTSSLPFGAFQYGFGSADSYGYPGGQSFSPVATVNSVLYLTPDGSGEIYTNKCWEAQVKDQNGDPVVGVKVDFNISGPHSALSGFALTDANGIAKFCYTGTQAGQDIINAAVGNIDDDSKFDWICNAPDFTNCPTFTNVNSNGPAFVQYNGTVSGSDIMNIIYTFSGATNGSGNGTGSGNTFNTGTTTVFIAATNDCGAAYCEFNITVTPENNNECSGGTPNGTNEVSGNQTITTQSEMNAFYSTVSGANNGKRWTKISGNLTLDGGHSTDPITDMCNLSSLTEITGNLNIKNFNKSANPNNLDNLSALEELGCELVVKSNTTLQYIKLVKLKKSGCMILISDNPGVLTVELPALESMAGEIINVSKNPKLEKLHISTSASSFKFTKKKTGTHAVKFADNGKSASTGLDMNFKKLKRIPGYLEFLNNDNTGVSNFDDIFTSLDTVQGKLTVSNNDYLNTCCIAVNAIVMGTRTISNNTGDCASLAVATSACNNNFQKRTKTFVGQNTKNFVMVIYPNPGNGHFNFDISTVEQGNLSISVYDIIGKEVFTGQYPLTGNTVIPVATGTLPIGQYIVQARMNGFQTTHRLTVVK